MDWPIKLFFLGLVLIFIVLIMVVGIEYQIPLFIRANFDDISNSYLAVIERDGGLDSNQRDTLTAELFNLGIINVNINAPVSGNWGEKVTLRIEGDYIFESTNASDLSKESISERIVYENSTIILSNY